MNPVSCGTKIVKVGAHRRVITVVESYPVGGDVVYLGLDRFNRPHDISHRALGRAVDRGDVVLVGGNVDEVMIA